MINWCVWHFRFGQNRNTSFIMSKVHALYFATRPGCSAPGIPTPSSSRPIARRIYGDAAHDGQGHQQGTCASRWMSGTGSTGAASRATTRNDATRHHNQIPEVYLERVILSLLQRPGDLVLDPFLGSGTTCTVARAWDRRSIGIEFSPGNAASAWERITEIGMLRKGASSGGSSAIFEKRRPEPADPAAAAERENLHLARRHAGREDVLEGDGATVASSVPSFRPETAGNDFGRPCPRGSKGGPDLPFLLFWAPVPPARRAVGRGATRPSLVAPRSLITPEDGGAVCWARARSRQPQRRHRRHRAVRSGDGGPARRSPPPRLRRAPARPRAAPRHRRPARQPRALPQVVELARLDADADHHVILHELIHGERLINCMDFSYRMLGRVAELVLAYPRQVHPLLANHEIAQLTGGGREQGGGQQRGALRGGGRVHLRR